MAEFYLLGNTSISQMFGAIVRTENKTFVIDGGALDDYKQLADFLREKANSHVDAWFFTHPHHDHIGAFFNLRKYAKDITVETVYHHFPNTESLCTQGVRSEQEKALWEDVAQWDSVYKTHTLSQGESFSFDEVTISVLRVWNPNITENLINNSSAVFRIDGCARSVLILGDLGVEGGEDVLKNCSTELLHTDYTQMAHHGQCGVSKEFYERIKPKRCIWPSPEWLWNNDAGNGFDTGPWQTVRTREWILAMGVTEHIVEKDGTQKIEI